ncbi:MAG: hypothetical protein GWP47_06975 [Actinobacteria bacterium]|nr:hypothetical protein [Actinomycetota bacterium]NCG37539.1 hypothetical protein [Actinomycetota bacterium]
MTSNSPDQLFDPNVGHPRRSLIMGIGAALIMPATLSTITGVFPPQE